MGHLLQIAELTLLVILTLLQLGRWSQKTEEGPADAVRIAKDAARRIDGLEEEFRKHRHSWHEYLNRRFVDLDRTYARKREVELQFETISARQESDADRLTALEEKSRRFSGV